jgi:hypothetical protein
MASIQEMQNNMTVFFSKRTGEIMSVASGIQDMNMFGLHKEDMQVICDCLQFPMDMNVIQNYQNFNINLDTKELQIKQNNSYPIAST